MLLLDQSDVLIPKQGTICFLSERYDLSGGSSKGRKGTNPQMTQRTEEEL